MFAVHSSSVHCDLGIIRCSMCSDLYLPRFFPERPRDLQDHDPRPLRIGNTTNGTPHGRHVQRLRGHYGDIVNLRETHTLWLSVPVLTGLIECIVQLFYSYRVSVLSGSKVVGCAIASIAVSSFVAAILDGVLQLKHGLYSHTARELSLAPCVWLAGSALCDVIIAAMQTYYVPCQNGCAFKATRNRIARLVRLTIETGILTATAATLVLVFLAVNEETYNTGPAFYLSKLYTNALLMIFNSRARV
ncbi:hypothetical protein BDZ89DRAFT_1209893, partial [Hymenopellis radicata]